MRKLSLIPNDEGQVIVTLRQLVQRYSQLSTEHDALHARPYSPDLLEHMEDVEHELDMVKQALRDCGTEREM